MGKAAVDKRLGGAESAPHGFGHSGDVEVGVEPQYECAALAFGQTPKL